MFGSRAQGQGTASRLPGKLGQRQWQARPCSELEDVELFIQAMQQLERDVAAKEQRLLESEGELAECKSKADDAKRRAVNMGGMLCEAQAKVRAKEETLAVLEERQANMGAELARLNKRCRELMDTHNAERCHFVEVMDGKTAALHCTSSFLGKGEAGMTFGDGDQLAT